MQTPYEELRELIKIHGIPKSLTEMPGWLVPFAERHQMKFAKPEYIIHWLKEPGRWWFGEPFKLD